MLKPENSVADTARESQEVNKKPPPESHEYYCTLLNNK